MTSKSTLYQLDLLLQNARTLDIKKNIVFIGWPNCTILEAVFQFDTLYL